MTLPLLFLITLAVTAWAVRDRSDPTPARIRSALVRFAVALLVCRLCTELGRLPQLSAFLPLLVGGRVVTGLVMWAQVAWLAMVGHRPGRFRTACAVLAVLAALGHAPWGVLGFFALGAAWSFRWLGPLSTRERFATALGAAALMVGDALRLPRGIDAPVAAAWLPLVHFGRWAHMVALLLVVAGLWHALGAFIRDPSLGIRTVRRRLALSHALVVLVPLLITIGLWVLTTWLGVGADRALHARRAVSAEADGMRAPLLQALHTPGVPDGALAAFASTRRAEWPGVRVYAVRGGATTRVAGDSARGERALGAWCARLDSLPHSGVVELQGVRWLGAAVRDSASGAGAVALVPVLEGIQGAPARLVGATLWLSPQAGVRSTIRKVAAAASRNAGAADTAEVAKLRKVTRRLGIPDSSVHTTTQSSPAGNGWLSFTTPSDTITLKGDDLVSDSSGIAGQALQDGLSWDGERWNADSFRMKVGVTPASAFAGMYQNVRENPLNAVPIAALAGLVLLLVPVALFNFTLVRQIGRSFVAPVAALREGTLALASSRHEYRIAVHGDDELWDAATAFNTMADGLDRGRELEKERDRLEAELDLARRIQRRLLPSGPPHIAGLEIAGGSEPAREVGGDYYDHIPLANGHVLLVIADVSGKGVPAALLMSAFRAALMSQDTEHTGPADVAARLNDFLHHSVDPGKFVTAFVGYLDGLSGRFLYANAGHNPPVLLRRDGRVEWLTTGGLILGILPDSRFELGEAHVEPGDMLALYTDGVTEGADATGEQFGEDRLVATLQRLAPGTSCAGIAETLVREVRAFEGAQGPADDLTLLVVRRPVVSAG